MSSEEDTTKYTLLTNIDSVLRAGDMMRMRMHCSAILLSNSEKGDSYLPHWTLRGFGTEAAWEVFDIHLDKEKHFPFTLRPFENEMVKILTESGAQNIFTGSILTLNDGTEFALYAEDSCRPIDVYEQVGDICRVWEVLYQKTAMYWHSPYMPRLVYGPPNPQLPRAY